MLEQEFLKKLDNMIISSLKGLCHEEIYRSHFGTCLYLFRQ